jgi:hypothetical protein
MEQVRHGSLGDAPGTAADAIELPSQIRVAHYRLTLEAVESLDLPPFKGSTLRGGFGAVFRRKLCVQPRTQNCEDCLLRSQCPYIYIFDTPIPDDAEVLRSYDDAVRPYAIKPPLDDKTSYAPGELLTFGLTLVGRAIEYLPYFVVVFEELGRQGLGHTRGQYALRQVETIHPWAGEERVIYSAGGQLKQSSAATLTRDDFLARARALAATSVSVAFLTPTRLKHRHSLVWEGPPFHVLIKALLGRVSSLSYFHCGERWQTDFRGWIERAKQVRLSSVESCWRDWRRRSGRQDQWVPMGGLMGRATYAGDLAPFLPLLALGEAVQVGKKTVFGNGWYEIEA